MINIKKASKLFLYFIFIIALIEGVTRVFFTIKGIDIKIYRNFSFSRSAEIFMPDELLQYKLIPNISRDELTSDFQVTYTINSLGLREKEIRDTSKFKILFLGDSHTFGIGVPYGSRFSDFIEKELKNVYTINAGIPGYGIHQMYLWLKHCGLKLKPDLVICSIIREDLSRAIYKKLETSPHLLMQKQETRECSEARHPAGSFIRRSERLLQKSYFYSFAKVEVKIWLMRSNLRKRDKKVWDERREKGDYGYKITTDEQRKMVQGESLKIFKNFKDLLEAAQVNFLVMNISIGPIPWLKDFLAGEHIAYLDLYSELRGVSNITFEINQHYNVKGNRIIANLVKAYLLEQKLGDAL